MYQADFDLFRQARAETLKLAGGLTQKQSEFRPAPGKWSLGEVLDHLLLSEQLYREKFTRLIQLQKAGKKAALRSSFSEIDTSVLFIPRPMLPILDIPFSIFNLFVPAFMREMLTQYRLMPAQNPRIATPRSGRPLSELCAELRSSFKETEGVFEANPGLNYRQMRFAHPLMGNNNALEVLRILALHERRHQSQIRDILTSRHFPKAE